MLGFLDRLRARVAALAEPQGREHREVRGFHVAVDNSRPDIATADVLERLDEALALIEQYQPARFRHMRRDVAHIWIARFACRGAYFRDTRTVLTELTFLARRDISPAVVASSMLHEGVHARVDNFRRHFGGMPSGDHAREERLCRTGELAFGRALPLVLGAPVMERARASLALGDADVAPEVDWQEAQRRVAMVDDAAPPGPSRRRSS